MTISLLPVAVIIPAFNRAHMISSTLESVFAQFPARAAEIWVVDDGSTDETAAVAEACGARVVHCQNNAGPGAARNLGLQATSQPWVAFLDSDDAWLPHHLEVLWKARSGRVLVGSSCLAWDEGAGKPTRVLGPLTRNPRVVASPADLLFPENFISQSAVLVDRATAVAVGGYDTKRRMSEDLHLWIRMIGVGSAIALPDVTVRYMVHSDQTVVASKAMRESHLAALEDFGTFASDPLLLEKRRASDRWDDMRSAQRQGRIADVVSDSVWLLRPRRLLAVLQMLRLRFRSRRHAQRLSFDGGPSAIVLRTLSGELAASTRVIDLRERSTWAVIGVLISRPAGVVVGGNALERLVARLLRVKPI